MEWFLRALMDDIFSFHEGRVRDVPMSHYKEGVGRPVGIIHPHRLADLVALFAQRGIMSFNYANRMLIFGLGTLKIWGGGGG